jgi:DNA helicase II / ATP-dependent DNA helicase PcrA
MRRPWHFKPSIYQEGLINFINNPDEGNGICNAVAGSGKSTSLHLIATNLLIQGISPSEIKIIVFGKQNSLDLIEKFGSLWHNSISTLHALGYHFCQEIIGERIKVVDQDKYRKIGNRLGYLSRGKKLGTLKESEAIGSETQFLKLYDFARFALGNFSPYSLEKLSMHHHLDEIYDFNACSEAMGQMSNEGTDQAYLNLVIDFTDMIYFPTVIAPYWNQEFFSANEYALIDECQDLNFCQIEMSRHLAKRLLYVGDPKQSIYGFAGAGIDSYELIKNKIDALELPLSVCYRCPTSHIELVNKIFPEIPIKTTPNAKKGCIESLAEDDVYHQQDDLILSRKTAPLVKYCLKLIARGLPAKVKGREIDNNLIKVLNQIHEYIKKIHAEFDLDNLIGYCEEYYKFKQENWGKYRNDQYKLGQSLDDKLEVIKIIYRNLVEQDKEAKLTLKAIKTAIKDIFSENNTFITLCTIHRAKGLEANRVYILSPDEMPMTWKNQQPWEFQQEKNLLYVALTRSKDKLFLLGDANWLDANGK